MLQAQIVSPQGSLYFAGAATPANIEVLRRHVRALQRVDPDVRLSVNLGGDEDGAAVPLVSELLGRLAAEGVHVTFSAAVDDVRRHPVAR